MPSMRKLKKAIDDAAAKRKIHEDAAWEKTKFLPPDLGASIIRACGQEQKYLENEIEYCTLEIEKLDKNIQEIRAAVRDSCESIPGKFPGRSRKTGEAVKLGAVLPLLGRQKRQFEFAISAYRAEIGTVKKVRRQVEAGLITGLLAITASWRSDFVIGGLSPIIAKLGTVFTVSDAAGYALEPNQVGVSGGAGHLEPAGELEL